MKFIGSGAKTLFYLKKIQGQYPRWRLHYKIKCKSTENELTNWLGYSEIKRNQPVAIIAREQFSGFGQNSRTWVSPKGGIWLSAAYPIFSKEFISQIFNLSLGIKICEMLRQENINVCLKWPNDIFFGSKKLIGFLPRVITRGKEIIYVRVGLGMNVLNYTPSEGISLSKVLQTKNINEHYWTAKVLKAFHDSVECNNEKEYVIKSANKFLTKRFLPSGFCPHIWKIEDIDSNGNLRIKNETQLKVIRRF
ncbi:MULTISPECIES: biotin--[acetyl-CoA-carboxylase] ligase [Prochlorococcus]|uniref:Biotin-protein ligase n=1 Tax=Prochlorococcus marinus str. MIT 9116 TaxID=167544 RepID=A0A0A1ZW22_PROMR|nr:biotin--[acetyl-CoA-carboxylase] ligase [Prochlorococcus marinus]KGF90150.1 Biotin-protein ligase [Prochlorococcus marinus str. MIT 9107]KGF92469.1 Biotin-protein ligase [Prochlorococcus marinus str. MIT 9116]KGF94912.1 Biotin-protein ligase [Prochlorococcus marinus str. MIT 9123]